MGRYDNIKLDYPIPKRLREPISMAIQVDLNQLSYQTKDFAGGYFEEYRIDEDGLLYKGHDRFDDAHAIPKWYFCSTYSGQFNIYAYFNIYKLFYNYFLISLVRANNATAAALDTFKLEIGPSPFIFKSSSQFCLTKRLKPAPSPPKVIAVKF